MRAQLMELTPDSADPVAEGVVVEHALDHGLAVVEGAATATACTFASVGVVIMRRCTSETRPSGKRITTSTRERAAEGLDRRAAGIAGGSADDGRAAPALSQHAIHEARQELHRHVLEGERRPMEQLEDEAVGRDLDERRDGRMAEAGIGIAGHAAQLITRERSADERVDDLDRDLRERPAGERGDGVGRKLRPRLGHIEPAVARQARQQHVLEAKRRGFASGRNVVHAPLISCDCRFHLRAP